MSVITVQGWIEEFRQAQENDAVVQQLIDEVESGQTAHGLYRLQDGLLWSEDKVVIPNNIQLKAKIHVKYTIATWLGMEDKNKH